MNKQFKKHWYDKYIFAIIKKNITARDLWQRLECGLII